MTDLGWKTNDFQKNIAGHLLIIQMLALLGEHDETVFLPVSLLVLVPLMGDGLEYICVDQQGCMNGLASLLLRGLAPVLGSALEN